jgi:hypothetical protein
LLLLLLRLLLLLLPLLHLPAGKQRRWDIIQAHSSVACVLYHKDMDAFLVVSNSSAANERGAP